MNLTKYDNEWLKLLKKELSTLKDFLDFEDMDLQKMLKAQEIINVRANDGIIENPIAVSNAIKYMLRDITKEMQKRWITLNNNTVFNNK